MAAVYPSPTLNFIVGKNASGKSAFLEAIFLLGRIKSFRCAAIKSVINSSKLELIVSAEILQMNGVKAHLGVQIDSKNYNCRINHQSTQKKSDFAYALP
jgi:DNA replication and repair protein RecF